MWTLLLSLALPAVAADHDPALHWQTLTTAHFRIHFHDGEDVLAREMSVRAETAWATLTSEIGTSPEDPIELVLVDPTDDANGYATVVPRNTIVIFVTAPTEDSTLAFYEDWNEAIVTHELTHILHIDTVEGLPKIARTLMGSIVSTHQASPGWIVEGYATFQETRFTTAGRGRAKLVDMMKRAAVLEDRFPRLGDMDGYGSVAPGGNLRYLWGQDFLQHIADRTRDGAWTDWVHTYGRSLPFVLPARRVFGRTFRELYADWRATSTERYRAQLDAIEAEGATEVTFLTPEARTCGTAAWSPTAPGAPQELAVSCSDPRRGSTTWLLHPDDGGRDEPLIKGTWSRTLAWRADGQALAYAKPHAVRLYKTYDDSYLYDIASKTSRALTRDARARDPVFAPGGERVYVVTNGVQDTRVQVLTADQRLRPLIDEPGATIYGTPRPSPDGRMLAVSVWRDGLRDLWLYTANGAPWRRVTMDAALDREPAWSPDGATLYFASDRGDKPDIHALDLTDGSLWRVTNVRTGAWGPAPSPDGARIAFTVHNVLGARIATIPVDRSTWTPLGALPTWADQPAGSLDATTWPEIAPLPEPTALVTATQKPAASDTASDAKPYTPWSTLFPPKYWLPGTFLTTTGESLGLYAVASTYAEDTLGWVGYGGYATYRTDANVLGGGAAVRINRWRPVVSVGANTAAWPFGDIYRETRAPDGGGATIPGVETTRRRYWDRRTSGYASVGYPLTDRTASTFSWQGTLRAPLDPLPEDAAPAYLPTRGFFSTLGAGWRYGTGTSYARSISPERARSLAVGVEWTPSFLGSNTYDDMGARVPFDQLQANVDGRAYLSVPRFDNHVLALRGATGITVGDGFRYGSYRLGGDFSEAGLTVLPTEWRMLRGFWPASDSGQSYALGSAEYRLPLLWVERGFGTLPAWVRNVHGAVFVDAGDAFDTPDELALGNVLVGTGAELRGTAIVAWGYPLPWRLGYAFAVSGDGKAPGSPEGLYASLGSSF